MKALLLSLCLLAITPLARAEREAGVSCEAYAKHNLFGIQSGSYSSCRSCYKNNRENRSIDCVQSCRRKTQECSVYSMDVGAGGMTYTHKAVSVFKAEAEAQARALCEQSIAGKSAAFCSASVSCSEVVEDLDSQDCR